MTMGIAELALVLAVAFLTVGVGLAILGFAIYGVWHLLKRRA